MDRTALVGTRIGAVAQRLREVKGLLDTYWQSPEILGEYGSEVIARQLLQGLCLPGRGFVDVGAHIGAVIAGVSDRCRPSSIIAVEAIPNKAESLRRRFPHVVVHACAVGDADADMPFFIHRSRSGYSTLLAGEDDPDYERIVVPVRRLSDLIGPTTIDVVKIDVEGAELAVLRGGEAFIRRDRPTILFESGPDEREGLTKSDMWDWFDRLDYALLVTGMRVAGAEVLAETIPVSVYGATIRDRGTGSTKVRAGRCIG